MAVAKVFLALAVVVLALLEVVLLALPQPPVMPVEQVCQLIHLGVPLLELVKTYLELTGMRAVAVVRLTETERQTLEPAEMAAVEMGNGREPLAQVEPLTLVVVAAVPVKTPTVVPVVLVL